jgi:hypothetical protein
MRISTRKRVSHSKDKITSFFRPTAISDNLPEIPVSISISAIDLTSDREEIGRVTEEDDSIEEEQESKRPRVTQSKRQDNKVVPSESTENCLALGSISTSTMIISQKTLLKTATSELTVSYLTAYSSLIQECIQLTYPLLDHYPAIKLYGKQLHQRRSVGFFSNISSGYSYSTTISHAKPLPKPFEVLLDIVNDLYGTGFNGILVNHYKDGNDYISRHTDDEKGLDNKSDIGEAT